MPISLEFHSPDAELAQRFSKVLRDDPDYAAELGQALDAGRPVAAAHFNGAPVAVALLDGNTLAWMVVHPATRGRGVGRDFLRLLEKHHGGALALPEKCQR